MQNRNVQYEKMISLETLIVACLKKWRLIIFATLIASFLFGVIEGITQIVDGTFQITDIIFKIIVGFLLGMMVSAGYVVVRVCVKVFFGKYLQSTSDFCKQLDIPILTSLYVPEKFKSTKKLTKLGRWIEDMVERCVMKMEGSNVVIDEENAYKIADAKIQVFAKGNKNVLLVGTGSQKLEDTYEILQKNCVDHSLEYVFAKDLLENREGILRLKDCVVVLVEKENKTELKKLADLVGFLAYSKAELVGAIIC